MNLRQISPIYEWFGKRQVGHCQEMNKLLTDNRFIAVLFIVFVVLNAFAIKEGYYA